MRLLLILVYSNNSTNTNDTTLDNKKAKRKQDPKADTRTDKNPGLGSQFGVFGAKRDFGFREIQNMSPFFSRCCGPGWGGGGGNLGTQIRLKFALDFLSQGRGHTATTSDSPVRLQYAACVVDEEMLRCFHVNPPRAHMGSSLNKGPFLSPQYSTAPLSKRTLKGSHIFACADRKLVSTSARAFRLRRPMTNQAKAAALPTP